MAQTIQIKRSTGSNAPSSLANGELAYLHHSSNKKLYIGDPGGASGDISVIGGKDFTDKLDLIGAANGTNAADASVVASANNLGVIRIGTGLSIAANGVVSADEVTATSVTNAGALMDTEVTNLAQVKAFSSSDYATAAQGTLATNALPKAGGTLTGDIVLGDNNKVQFGGTTTNLEIYNDGTTSYIKENASGDLEIHATDFTIKDGGGQTMMSFDADGVLRLYDQSETNPVEKLKTQTTGIYVNGTMNSTGIKLGNEAVTISSIKDEDDMSSNSATALATQQSIKAFVEGKNYVTTSGVTSIQATSPVTVTNGSTASPTIGVSTAAIADGGTGLATADQIHTFVTTHTGNFTFSADEISSSGATMTLDPAADGITGKVVVNGDLEVKGTTTTIESTTIDLGDTLINLNSNQDESSAPPTSLTAGITVDRGNASYDSHLLWKESSDTWRVSTGGNIDFELLHTGNSSTATYTLDGGTFS